MKQEIEYFERRFAELLRGTTLPMDAVMRYVGTASGKRLRPLLVYQSARLFGDINDCTRRTALFVELLHTATLIHDDVVDEADVRRGQASVNARFGNKTAVLAGDYLLSKAMLLLAEPTDGPILKVMLETAMTMSEGEMVQSEELGVRSEELGVGSEERYLDIITRKTARLIQTCCVCGAMGVLEPGEREKLEKIGGLGLNLGLVFQMRDDILDRDDPATTALAEKLLPEYLNQTLQSLEALAGVAKRPEVIEEFRELTIFCAERKQ